MPKADHVQGVTSTNLSWLNLMSAVSLSRLGARSGGPLPGGIVKIGGYFVPVRVGRISMVGDGFAVKSLGNLKN